MKSYESSAKTIEEAISAGLEKLGGFHQRRDHRRT